MPDLIANAYFPGIVNVISFSCTLGHGITPSVFELKIAPQDNLIAKGGDFTILIAGGGQIVFSDCKVQTSSYHFDESGAIISLSILDRRWKWQFGQISGSYNLRTLNNKIVKSLKANAQGKGNAILDSEQTPQQLAKLCLDAMGESGYNVDDLPNDARPLCNWDVLNPARALAALVERLGCRVVLSTKTGNVAIRVLGQGAELPKGFFIDLSDAIDPPQRPDSITVATGRVRWQYDFELEPVGEETDGSIQILSKLSYAPLNRFGIGNFPGGVDPDGGFLESFTGEFSDIQERSESDWKLAAKSVFRWYRIKLPNNFTVPNPNGGAAIQIQNLEQILPIDDNQCSFYTTDSGFVKAIPAIVYGVYFDNTDASSMNNIPKMTQPTAGNLTPLVTRRFEIDKQLGVVKFEEPVVAMGSSDPADPTVFDSWVLPTLKIRTGFFVRDVKTAAWIRYGRNNPIADGDKFNTKPLFLKVDQISPVEIAKFGDLNSPKPFWSDNLAEVNQQCDLFVGAAMNTYEQKEPQSMKYAGILAVELDGALQSVTWQFSQAGAFTTINRNRDVGSKTTVPYALQRQAEKNWANRDLAQQLEDPNALLETIERVKVN